MDGLGILMVVYVSYVQLDVVETLCVLVLYVSVVVLYVSVVVLYVSVLEL